MRELSLNILDIAENSLTAKATLVKIDVTAMENTLTIEIADNGCGMSAEFLQKVTDPYTTTRTTRKVGMGLPLIKMQAEMCGGNFEITSKPKVGTTVKTTFQIDHIDRPPLGNVGETMMTLLSELGQTQLVFCYTTAKGQFLLDTNQLKIQLEDVPLDTPEVLIFVKQLIQENITTLNGGIPL